MHNRLNRRIISVITILCILVLMLPCGKQAALDVKAAERFILSGKYNITNLECDFQGTTAAQFTVGDNPITVLSDLSSFNCTLTLPDVRYQDNEVRAVFTYLVPVQEDREQLLDYFVSGNAYSLTTNSSLTKCYVDYRTSDEVYLQIPNVSVVYSNPAFYYPSGVYEIATLIVLGESDFMLNSDMELDCTGLKGELYFSENPVVFSSDADGGYNGPDILFNKRVTIDADVYAEGELLSADRINIIGYDENGSLLGMPPFSAESGSKVYFTVDLGDTYAEYRYLYEVPDYDNMYEATVPDEDGTIEISLISFERNSSVSGRLSDKEGNPAAYVTVSAAQNAAGQTAMTTLTDEDGYFNISGLYDYAALELSVESNRYNSFKKHYSSNEVFGNVFINETLEAKEIAFFLDFESDAQDTKFAEAVQSLVNSMNYKVVDQNNDFIGGRFEYINGTTFCFIPTKAQDKKSVYSVTIDSDIVLETSVSVAYGETKAVPFKVNTGVSYRVCGGPDEGDTLRTFLFDASGKLLKSESFIFSGEENIRHYLTPGTYTIVAFGGGDNIIVSKAADLAAVMEFYAEDITVTEGSNDIDLGNLVVPYASCVDNDFFTDATWVNTGCEVKAINDLIPVTAHFEVYENMAENSELTGLRISTVGSNAVQTSEFAEGSLVINGIPTECSYDILTGRIDFEPVKFPCDISYKMRAIKEGDVILTMDAIVMLASVEIGIPFLDKIIKGASISLSVPTKTADGTVLVRGTANVPHVSLYDDGKYLTDLDVDDKGTFEGYISLPVTEGKEASCRLYAQNPGTGEKSEVKTVLYTPNDAVTKALYILVDDERAGQVYTWREGAYFSFEADMVNVDKLSENPTFYIKFSDGSVEIFDSKLKAQNGNISTFTTGTVEFGNKLPLKIHLSTGASQSLNQVIEKPALEKCVSIAYANEETALKALADEAARRNTGFTERDGLIDKAEMEEGRVYYYSILKSNVSENEITAYSDISNRHIVGTDAYGNEAMDIYLASDSYCITRAVYDRTEQTGYIEKLYSFTTENYNEVTAVINLHKLSKLQREDSIFLLSGDTQEKSISEDNQKEFDNTLDTLIIPTALDFVTEKLGDFGYELPGSGNAANFFVIKACANEINTYYNSMTEVYEQMKEVNALKQTVQALADKGMDVTKLQNQINNAENSYNTVINLATRELIAALENNGLSIAAGCVDGPYTVLLTAGTYIGGYMTGDMQTNIDIVLRGANGDLLDAEYTALKQLGMTMDEYRLMLGNQENGKTPEESAQDIIDKIREAEEKLEREKQKAEEARLKAEELGTYEAEDADEEFVDEYYKWKGECEDSDNTENDLDLTPIIDPSGYIYEAVASNRIENATVMLINARGELFDAAYYGQTNPLRTGSNGKYAWDVPEGNWLVVAAADGYESNNSENDPAATVTIYGVNYLPVMPPQLDVNIGLTSFEKAKADASFDSNKAVLSFDKYIKTDNFKEHLRISVAGVEIAGTDFEVNVLNAEVSPDHTPYCGGEELATEYEISFANDIAGKQVIISFDELYDYSNTLCTSKVASDGDSVIPDPGTKTGNANDNSVNNDIIAEEREEQRPEKSINYLWIVFGAGIGLLLVAGVSYYIKKKPKEDKKS